MFGRGSSASPDHAVRLAAHGDRHQYLPRGHIDDRDGTAELVRQLAGLAVAAQGLVPSIDDFASRDFCFSLLASER
jgi:hypothetical protein